MQARALEGMEVAVTLTGEVAPFNAVACLELAAPPEHTRLPAALAAVQGRHPLLAAAILGEGRRLRFELLEPAPPIPLTVEDPGSDRRWLEIAETELNRPFDRRVAPLVRCRALPDRTGDVAWLVLSAHHAILDAPSMTALLDELVAAWCGDDDGFEAQTEPGPPSAALAPPGQGGALGGLGFLARQLRDEAVYRVRRRRRPDPPIPGSHHNRVAVRTLDAEATRALSRWCRSRRLPLGTVILAAMAQAVDELVHGAPTPAVRCITFPDMRPYLRPPVPTTRLGAHMAMLRVTVPGSPDLATLASQLNAALLAAGRRGDRVTADRWSPRMMAMMLRRRPGRMATTALSYTGPPALTASRGGTRVVSLRAWVSAIDQAPVLVAQARPMGGRLLLDFSWLAAELDDDAGGRLVDRVVERLSRRSAESGRGRPDGNLA